MLLIMEKNKNIDNFLKHVSNKKSGWLEKAKWQEENEDWLDISFDIALRIASTLSANKKANVYPKNQAELAVAMGCSAQYVNKLLKGQENLQIETICKIGRILGITLIEVPKIEIKQTIQFIDLNWFLDKTNLTKPSSVPPTAYVVDAIQGVAGENNYALAA
jgi:transcriptional regulator with XRE-family HTH domain